MNMPPKERLLGVGISTTNYDEVAALCRHWVEERRAREQAGEERTLPSRRIAAVCVHPLMTSVFAHPFRDVLNDMDIATPDGMPVAWALRSFGVRRQPRVYGPTLMLKLCEQAAALRHRIYLFGSTEEVLSELRARLEARFPGLAIAGWFSPPFRPLSAEEDAACIRRILDAGTDILFVGLGAPKQEYWLRQHAHALPGVVMLAVGAAFAFHAGRVRQAPAWMQGAGLEWLFRLIVEPARLWKRYLFFNPLFLVMWGAQLTGRIFRRG